jgi:large subunit ribosomal protein L25
MLSIDSKEFEKILRTSTIGSVLLKLQIKNGQTGSRSAMVKELQTHPVTGQFLHIDFYEVDLTRKINAMIPVTVTGKSQGVEDGGILQIVRREIEVFCLPTAIPESIEVDISELEIGGSIHVNEITLPSDVELPEDVDFTVITILAPKVEEEVVEVEELAEGEEVPEEGAEEAAEGEEAPAEEESKGE